MADIKTFWNPALNYGDWQIAAAPTGNLITDLAGNIITDLDGNAIADLSGAGSASTYTPGLVSGDDLETAVLISLFTDAQAGPDDIIPDGTTNRRGWWGDPNMGSKIWLRRRSKASPALLPVVQADIQNALQWLIDDGVAASIDVVTEWTMPTLLGSAITITKTDGVVASFAYDWAWQGV